MYVILGKFEKKKRKPMQKRLSLRSMGETHKKCQQPNGFFMIFINDKLNHGQVNCSQNLPKKSGNTLINAKHFPAFTKPIIPTCM